MIVYVKWIAVIFLIFLIYIYIAKVPKKQNTDENMGDLAQVLIHSFVPVQLQAD